MDSWNQKVYFESLRGNSKRYRTMHSRTKKLLIQHNEMNRLLELEVKRHLFETRLILAEIQRLKQRHLEYMHRLSLDAHRIQELTEKRHSFISHVKDRHADRNKGVHDTSVDLNKNRRIQNLRLRSQSEDILKHLPRDRIPQRVNTFM